MGQHIRWLKLICITGMNSSGIHVRYREQGRVLIIKTVFRLQPPPVVPSPRSHVGPILLSRAGQIRGCGQIRIRITQQRRIWKCNSLTPLLWSLIRSSKSDAAPQLAGHGGFPHWSLPCFLFFRETALSCGNGNLSYGRILVSCPPDTEPVCLAPDPGVTWVLTILSDPRCVSPGPSWARADTAPPGRAGTEPRERERQTIHSPTVAWTGRDRLVASSQALTHTNRSQIINTDTSQSHGPVSHQQSDRVTSVTQTVRMTGITMLRMMVVLLVSIGLSVAKQVSDKPDIRHKSGDASQHPNSVYSQMHPKHSRKAADMKIFYQTGVSDNNH